MIATTEMEARHPIPGCSYSIHASSIGDLETGKPAGPIIKYARVGDRVLHQWHCDDRTKISFIFILKKLFIQYLSTNLSNFKTHY